MARSAERRVSNHGGPDLASGPSFETPAFGGLLRMRWRVVMTL
jgi:hypothetical protein